MTNQEKEILFRSIQTLAMLMNRELTKELIILYVENLEDMPFERVMSIIKNATKTCRYMPTIAEIRELAVPKEDERDIANEMAGTILDAITAFGRYQSDRVKRHIGPEAWFAVERFGGWNELCDTLIDQMPTVRAQLRDICKSVLAIKKRDVTKIDQLPMEFQRKGTKKLLDMIGDYNTDRLRLGAVDQKQLS